MREIVSNPPTTHLFIHPYIQLFIHSSATHPSIYPSVHPTHPLIHPSTHPTTHPSIHPAHPSIHPPIQPPSIYPSIPHPLSLPPHLPVSIRSPMSPPSHPSTQPSIRLSMHLLTLPSLPPRLLPWTHSSRDVCRAPPVDRCRQWGFRCEQDSGSDCILVLVPDESRACLLQLLALGSSGACLDYGALSLRDDRVTRLVCCASWK